MKALLIISLFLLLFSGVNRGQTFWSDEKPQTTSFDNTIFTRDATQERIASEAGDVLVRRCVVCHGCYDAPCQLKLTSYDGLVRGASSKVVYNPNRLTAAEPTRLHVDATLPSEWREKGFFPVLNEGESTAKANINDSVLAQLLLLKREHPLPKDALLPETFTLNLNRESECPATSAMDEYKKDFPLWGMPYGLPGLSNKEHKVLLSWLADGAPRPKSKWASTAPFEKGHRQWEAFLNQSSLKAQLMSRYLYEHLFLADLLIDDAKPEDAYRLVRSSTPPGKPVRVLPTRRPFDTPGVSRVYYRLVAKKDVPIEKTLMVYQLNEVRLKRWQAWFLNDTYTVNYLPSYKQDEASNPFLTFQQIPVKTRYRFLLDEAQYTIMGFIKGPVCRGRTALNVINDHFWVTFVDPDLPWQKADTQPLFSELKRMNLPAEASSTSLPTDWLFYAKQEESYLKTKSDFLTAAIKNNKMSINLDMLWKGDGKNANAALTVFRHFDSATVVKGLQGDTPQTAWVISYPLLERIHYLLVAGYDVYGNLGHQLNTRIYMDFLRMEGEFNFLMLLPEKVRKKVRDHWYRGSHALVKNFVYNRGNHFNGESDIQYATTSHLNELYQKLRQEFAPVKNGDFELSNGFNAKGVIAAWDAINQSQGGHFSVLPQTSIVKLTDTTTKKTHYYTIFTHNAYTNISHLFDEKDRRLPKEDTASVLYGVVGAYPNAFFDVETKTLAKFSDAVLALKNEKDYTNLMNEFGVRRTSPKFWQFSDDLHQWMFHKNLNFVGWLDYNRIENR